MLALFLLASQTGLEAKSRQDDLKDRDHDAEERDHEKKKDGKHRHYSRYKKHIKHRHSHSIRDELESINKTIADIQTEIAALGQPGGGLPGDLMAKLDALQLAMGDNSSDIFSILGDITIILEDIKGISENGIRLDELKLTVADLSLKLTALTLTVDALDLRISALEQSTPPSVSEHVFSREFFKGVASTVDNQQLAWNQFRGNITGEFTSIEITNSFGGSALCSDPLVSTNIANALKSFVTGAALEEFNCGVNQEWSVGDCGAGVTLHAGSTTAICWCDDGATVRPLNTNPNWGGIGITCDAPTQTLGVILTR